MINESMPNNVKPVPRGWEALEIKLRGKGLSQGEIAEARKSFYDGVETLAKMFLSTYSVEKLKMDSRFRGNDNLLGNDKERLN